MGYITTVRAFRSLARPDPLVDSYRLLVAIELSLKDANFGAVGGGHDVPSMLSLAAASAAGVPPFVSGRLIALATTLRNDLVRITCNDRHGNPIPVPGHSYPYLRYSRRNGDWAGVSETPQQLILDLEYTCRAVSSFLLSHGTSFGVAL
ncbi:hypothetical protein [Variovorax beijingensis]|uniref:hypothetical protein n=1 Tax=Variovorax beijingensis TaxID=2496117 RepID=UPI00163ABDC5|nr:hypothetical protein [Variovorax beijingensis]